MKKKKKSTYCVQVFCRRCGGHVSYTMSATDKPVTNGEHGDWEKCIKGLASRIFYLEEEDSRRQKESWL